MSLIFAKIDKERDLRLNEGFLYISTLRNVISGSSGADNLFMQRNPDDIITILETIFDIKKDQAFKMVTENPIKAILKGKQRKLFKTTLDIIKNDDNNK